jgi:hypothetical protein
MWSIQVIWTTLGGLCWKHECFDGHHQRGDSMLSEGFLGTLAPWYADLVLVLEIGMGVALLVGAMLARRRQFRLHALCQSFVVLLNTAVVVLVMIPSFHLHVSPGIPAKLGHA